MKPADCHFLASHGCFSIGRERKTPILKFMVICLFFTFPDFWPIYQMWGDSMLVDHLVGAL